MNKRQRKKVMKRTQCLYEALKLQEKIQKQSIIAICAMNDKFKEMNSIIAGFNLRGLCE